MSNVNYALCIMNYALFSTLNFTLRVHSSLFPYKVAMLIQFSQIRPHSIMGHITEIFVSLCNGKPVWQL